MKPPLFNKILSTLLILMTFISCSDGGIGGSGISVGPISDFGSVFVNDVEFDTRQAVIHLNGIPAKEAELRIGMIVTVHGTFHSDGLTGNATIISYENTIKGIIQEIDSTARTVIVLGQTIFIDEKTVIEGTSFELLAKGQTIEISGDQNADGAIRASFLRRNDLGGLTPTPVDPEITSTPTGLKGRILNLDQNAMTFTIGTLTIHFENAVLEKIPNGILTDNLFVEVRGVLSDDETALFADRIEAEDLSLEVSEGEKLKIAGLVTAILRSDLIEVNTLRVLINKDTKFVNGTGELIKRNTRLQVIGIRNADGVIRAETITFPSDLTSQLLDSRP